MCAGNFTHRPVHGYRISKLVGITFQFIGTALWYVYPLGMLQSLVQLTGSLQALLDKQGAVEANLFVLLFALTSRCVSEKDICREAAENDSSAFFLTVAYASILSISTLIQTYF